MGEMLDTNAKNVEYLVVEGAKKDQTKNVGYAGATNGIRNRKEGRNLICGR